MKLISFKLLLFLLINIVCVFYVNAAIDVDKIERNLKRNQATNQCNIDVLRSAYYAKPDELNYIQRQGIDELWEGLDAHILFIKSKKNGDYKKLHSRQKILEREINETREILKSTSSTMAEILKSSMQTMQKEYTQINRILSPPKTNFAVLDHLVEYYKFEKALAKRVESLPQDKFLYKTIKGYELAFIQRQGRASRCRPFTGGLSEKNLRKLLANKSIPFVNSNEGFGILKKAILDRYIKSQQSPELMAAIGFSSLKTSKAGKEIQSNFLPLEREAAKLSGLWLQLETQIKTVQSQERQAKAREAQLEKQRLALVEDHKKIRRSSALNMYSSLLLVGANDGWGVAKQVREKPNYYNLLFIEQRDRSVTELSLSCSLGSKTIDITITDVDKNPSDQSTGVDVKNWTSGVRLIVDDKEIFNGFARKPYKNSIAFSIGRSRFENSLLRSAQLVAKYKWNKFWVVDDDDNFAKYLSMIYGLCYDPEINN